jgi:hypothetical protein
MRMAFTMDDLPVYPHLALPEDETPFGVAAKIMKALDRHGLSGVFCMANSWPLDVDEALAGILDDWVAAGHHIGNHTHSHPLLNLVEADDFIHDVSVADELLAPWISKAPVRAFRHPLDLWGDTEEKLTRVNAHLAALSYRSADVTSWYYEWEWDRAWRWLIQMGRRDEALALRSDFVDYMADQLSHDMQTCRDFFGHDVVAIGLAHNVPFFAEVADDVFGSLIRAGVEFVSLEQALDDPAYARSGTIVTDAFQTYQVKIAASDGRSIAPIPPKHADLIKRVFELATPLRPERRCMLVENRRPRPA